MVLLAVLLLVWFLFARYVNLASNRTKFLVALGAGVFNVTLVALSAGFPSISAGLMACIFGAVVCERGIDWYRSLRSAGALPARLVNPASNRTKFFLALGGGVVNVTLVGIFAGFPSIGVGLMACIFGIAVCQRGIVWYRSLRLAGPQPA